jgi:FkbM family methyltransferase
MIFTKIKRFVWQSLENLVDLFLLNIKYNYRTYGLNDVWTINDSNINKDSIIISGGVGKDISFERELTSKFGCKIYLFDPSETGIKTMKLKENKLSTFIFHKEGLAGSTKMFTFHQPKNKQEGSFYLTNSKTNSVNFDCVSLKDFMYFNALGHIDLLKLDIEGFEFQVLESIFDNNIKVKQICFESHYKPLFDSKYNYFDHLKLMLKLKNKGYDYIYRFNQDHTFYLKD